MPPSGPTKKLGHSDKDGIIEGVGASQMEFLHRIISHLWESTEPIPSVFRLFSSFFYSFIWLLIHHLVLTFSADGAAMGPVSCMQPLVGLEAVRVPQWLSTVATEEASAGVGQHVPTEFWFLGETLLTLGAGKWLFSIVDPQVTLKVPWEADRQRSYSDHHFVWRWACLIKLMWRWQNAWFIFFTGGLGEKININFIPVYLVNKRH